MNSIYTRTLTYCLGLIIGFFPAFSYSQTMNLKVETVEEIKAASIIPIHEDTLAQDHEGLSVTYNPAELNENIEDLTREDILSNAIFMKSEEYPTALTQNVIIPLATSQDELMSNINNFNDEELKVFISKKNQFLKKISKTFIFFRLKPASVNKIVSLINDQFYANAQAVANANAKVFTLQWKIAGGFGLSDWILSKLKTNSYLKHLPNTSGFYFVLSTGISVVVTKKDGKSKISLEPVVEFHRMIKVFSPFIIASTGLMGSYTAEKRSPNDPALQVAQFYSMPAGVNIISNLNQFGMFGSAALSVLPGGGAAAAFEGKMYRLRIKLSSAAELIASTKEFLFKPVRVRSKRLCSMIFGGS